MPEFIFMENQRNTTVHYVAYYSSPLGTITMAADKKGLIGLWFEGQKHYGRGLSDNPRQAETPMIRQTRRWLDLYFAGQPTDFTPPLHLTGSDFQLAVWHELLTIAAGQTATYRQIAMSIARRKGVRRMPLAATPSRLSSPAIGYWARTAACEAMRADWNARSGCFATKVSHCRWRLANN